MWCAGALGDKEEKDDKKEISEEEEAELAEARREEEERRADKYRKMEEERETMRQGIRDKVYVPTTTRRFQRNVSTADINYELLVLCLCYGRQIGSLG